MTSLSSGFIQVSGFISEIMCDTLTREIIAQKNHGNCLILTRHSREPVYVQENV